MSQQPTRIDLRQLEQLTPPSDRLSQVLAGQPSSPAIGKRAGSRGNKPWPYWAAAAAALLAIGLAITLAPSPQTAPAAGSELASARNNLDNNLSNWITYSQQLEGQLKALGPVNGVVRGHRAAAINVLREELELIDLALTQTQQPDEALVLWRARTSRLNDLLAVHAANVNPGTLDSDKDPSVDPVITLQAPLTAMPAVIQF